MDNKTAQENWANRPELDSTRRATLDTEIYREREYRREIRERLATETEPSVRSSMEDELNRSRERQEKLRVKVYDMDFAAKKAKAGRRDRHVMAVYSKRVNLMDRVDQKYSAEIRRAFPSRQVVPK